MSATLHNRSPGVRETFWQTLEAFNATRLAIAVVLLLYLSFNSREGYWVFDQFFYLESCVLYLVLALLALAVGNRVRHHFTLQVMVGITVDIAVMSTFYIAAGGARSGLGILFLFPLAGGAILVPLVPALFLASLVTLIMLVQSGTELLQDGTEPTFSQSGLSGAAFFAAVLVLNRLARRLVRQERLAAEREASLQAQQAINRIVIADSGDGILVVDSDTSVYVANPAAERMIGISIAYRDQRPRLAGLPSLAPVTEAFRAWRELPAADQGAASAPFYVMIKHGDAAGAPPGQGQVQPRREPVTHARLRFVSAFRAGEGLDRSVIFLEDVSEIENRAQQLKLASMGRLTASIAHEVRNPLSAISYAISLMTEEPLDPSQRRLAQIVDDNVVRLNRLIEDILKLSRRAQSGHAPVALRPALVEIVSELEATGAVQEGMISIVSVPDQPVAFDPLHLREVIVNLLSNAARYASGCRGSIRLSAGGDAGGRPELHVEDDGPGITPEVRAHLFEPFYTTSSKGTGLGLYAARELCLNNGAMLDYEYRTDLMADGKRSSGRFVITFSRPLASHAVPATIAS
ncbi:two-component system sensor histidine kinase NtrB [Lacisediminimonas profundi]|uniref:two-component system sensor histidine kinase NtrB n=1 Tax=Lacisediminimonas profundi TaxID=2603856 RepID=UPI00124B0E79|nr:PAS domain-containing sensor histidine kinase [Lacisediminimonas profundi]